MKPDHIKQIRQPGALALSPDGSQAIFVENHIQDDAYWSSLWIAATHRDAPPQRLTDGPRDMAPVWSPDGRWLAFLRAEGDGQAQLHVMLAQGGEARCLTAQPLGVGSAVTTRHPRGRQTPVWSPDSRKIAYLARVEQTARAGQNHRRITQLRYRVDELGFVHDRRSQAFVVDLEGGQPTMLTDGKFDHWDMSWHPDGKHLVAATARHGDCDLDEANDIVLLGLDGSSRILTRRSTTVNLPTVHPDGEAIYFVGIGPLDADPLDARGRNVGLWRITLSEGSAPERLTDTETVDLDDGRTRPLLIDAEGVLAGNLCRGAVHLCKILFDGSIRTVIGGRRQVLDYAVAAGVVAAVVGDEACPGEVIFLRDGEEIPCGDRRKQNAELGFAAMEEINTTSPDGYPVHGWLFKPAGQGPHPLIYYIHGGPDMQVGHSFFDEAQVYAGAGYAVLIGNPRGAAGYGEAHARSIRGSLGTVDIMDMIALHDDAIARDDIDEARCGVMGGSYGGFATGWLAAHEPHRFRAALGERGVYNHATMFATSDISVANVSMVGPDPATWAGQSPLTYADRIGMPMLIMHWEGDRRVPFDQAQQLFTALRSGRKPVELVIFPAGSHNSSRGGPPKERVERFGVVLEWFDRHLGAK